MVVAAQLDSAARTNLSGRDGEKSELDIEIEKYASASDAVHNEKLQASLKEKKKKASFKKYELTYGAKTGPAEAEEAAPASSDEGSLSDNTLIETHWLALRPSKRSSNSQKLKDEAENLKADRAARRQSREEAGLEDMMTTLKENAAARAAASLAAEQESAKVQAQQLAALQLIASKLSAST